MNQDKYRRSKITTQDCVEFKALVQGLMDNKEMEFYEEIENEKSICTSESTTMAPKVNYPVIIISWPKSNKAGVQIAPRVIIQKPVTFSYKDSKRVPWNYECNVVIPGKENLASASKEDQDVGSHTRSGRRYNLVKGKALMVEQEKEKLVEPEPSVNEPMKEEEAKEFLKFLKHSEYSVVEQLHKQPARISVLALLLSSDVHRNALMKVLNETYVANDISVNNLDRLIGNISADSFIHFNDDEITSGGRGSTRALHITTRCKGYTLPRVLIDNGTALNVDFLVMDIKPSYNCLLRRPWIHLTGAVPSSLHQKLKLVLEGWLVTINAEEDIIADLTSDMPYLEINDETTECYFRSLEFVNATFITEGNRIPIPKISITTRMGLLMTVGRGVLPGKGLGKYLQGRVVAPMLKEKQDHFGLGFKPDAKQKRKELERMQKRRKAHLSGEETKLEPLIIPHISKTFVSGVVIHTEQNAPKGEDIIIMLGNVYINAISDEAIEEGTLSDIRPYELGSVLDNWTIEEIPIVFRAYSEKGKVVNIGKCIAKETKWDLVELLQEFKDIFAWSYRDMPGLITNIVVHCLPIKEDCKPVQQKLRRMRPDIVLKIKEEVKKQFDAGFLQEIKYLEWVANIVPVPKKDGKLQMCGTFCYKVMPFGLKNARATYQGAMVTLFHDMMHKEIEVYVHDMIAKSRTEERGIEIDSDKVNAIQKLPPSCTQKEVRGFLGRLNYIAWFISQLTEKCDPIFRNLKNHNPGVWDDECQRAFDKIKQYLSSSPVLSPPCPDRPLILYLTVFYNSMGYEILTSREIVLHSDLDNSEAKTIHVVPHDLVDIEAGSSEVYDEVNCFKWKDGQMENPAF
ncbi:hypothetical protein EPI10_021921 [Gossypium australe]|uniref:Uncharacterized protein n=1 Tax=Gossypium australe TaxID=47621 RepID=A0A5B6WL49_9ROSI|nr:hypothetical protein EPI10_021921 [Gossypium australe]